MRAVVDADNNTPLAALGQLAPNGMAQGRRVNHASHHLPQLASREVQLRLSLAGADTSVHLHGIDYYNIDAGSPDVFPKDAEGGTSGFRPPARIATLEQNHPNPFNSGTTIVYELPHPSLVTLTLVDELGRTVAVLEHGSKAAGGHIARFDGSGLASGIYRCRLETENGRAARTMHLVK